MTIYEIIEKKKHNVELTTEEIRWFVAGFTAGDIPDYQASALLMAICFFSLNERETLDLTMAMAKSGDMFKPELDGFCVDKHSTGGVGDKTTLIVAPTVAACGVYVPKMSGRGLGHTGGTIDKLESIPGFNTSLNYDRFIEIVKKAGFAVAGQTGSLVPADKKLYALRSATATVDSVPLIASSVMSKKLATGADGIVLDVKVGDGAFMKKTEDAEELARLMVKTAQLAGRKCTAVISGMEQPLGYAVGNSLEVIEAIEALKGNCPEDLYEVCVTLAAEMLTLAGKGTAEECRALAQDAIKSGAALERLKLMIKLQGGNPAVTDDYTLFKQAERTAAVKAAQSGFVSKISCEHIGMISVKLGAGRQRKEDNVDFTAGIVFRKKVGDKIEKGETIADIYTSSPCDLEEACEEFTAAIQYSPTFEGSEEKIIKKIVKGY